MSLDKLSLPLSGPSPKRFSLSTSDVLEGGQKVFIKDEETGEIRWCKTRTLAHKEILDEIRTPEPPNALKYTIHRPIRGWYIHVRHGDLPPLALTPNPLTNSDSADADCELIIQLPVTRRLKGKERAQGLREQDEWSFPPTPSIRSPPPGRRTTSASNSKSSSPVRNSATTPLHTDPLRSPSPPRSSTSISKLVSQSLPSLTTISLTFAPLPPPTVPAKQPILSRAYASGFLRVLANTLFSPPRRSFVLSVCPTPDLQVPGTEPISTPSIEAGSVTNGPGVPVLTYTDTTPVLSVSRMTGVLVIDMAVLSSMLGDEEGEEGGNEMWEEQIGVLVTASLAYLDFLGDREGYIAAANGG